MNKKYRGLPKKAAKKAAKHKPDWVKFLGDQINAVADRVAALERAQTNPIPDSPTPEVVMSQETDVLHGE